MGSSTGKKGGKKCGRDRVKCARYRTQGRCEKNRLRRSEKERKRQERFKIRHDHKLQSTEHGSGE